MNKFEKKEISLKKALERVKNRLQEHAEYSAAYTGNDRPRDAVYQEKTKWWNHFHDLETRIENRLWDNWSAFKDWHWDQHGFNTY